MLFFFTWIFSCMWNPAPLSCENLSTCTRHSSSVSLQFTCKMMLPAIPSDSDQGLPQKEVAHPLICVLTVMDYHQCYFHLLLSRLQTQSPCVSNFEHTPFVWYKPWSSATNLQVNYTFGSKTNSILEVSSFCT